MLTATKQNFCFTSGILWVAFLISFPWVALATGDFIDPHREIWSAVLCGLSGLFSLSLVVYSWIRGERQMLFLFIVFLFGALTTIMPLVCVRHGRHNHPMSRSGGSAGVSLVNVGVFGTLPPVG